MRLCRPRELCWTALLLSALPVTGTYAAGLGALNLQSALAEPLRASIPLLGQPRLDGAHCISARLAALDGTQLAIASAHLESGAQASMIRLRTERGINEPVVNIVVDIGCGVSLHRQYQVLLDPVGFLPAALPPQSAPARKAVHSAPAHHVAPQKKHRHPHAARNPAPSADVRAPHHAMLRPHPQETLPAKPPHSVLRLGPTDSVAVYHAPRLHLRLSDHLTRPPAPEAAPPIPASEPVAPTAARSDQEPEQRVQRLLDSLEAEAASLRIETARIKQENSAYRSALEGKHNDSLNWIKGLGLLLLACVVAVGWLLWRVITMKQSAPHPWHELFSTQEANTIDSALMAGNTEFSTTALDLSELRTEQFDTVTSNSNGQSLTDSLARSDRAPDAALPAPQSEPATTRPPSDAPPLLPEPVPAAPEHRVPSRRSHATAAATEHDASSLKAEEVSDVMELVQVWMTLNAPEKVLELLKPFSDVEQPESPLPWLCLLDVYRALGDRPKYEAILERIKTIFNVKLAPWTPLPYVEPPKVLSDFPHVIEEIVDRWQAGDVVPYLKRLLVDDRDGTRHGFDLPVYRDILQLIDIAGGAGRLEEDEVMPEGAYRLLFGRREQAMDIAGTPERRAARTPAKSATSAQLPTRPRYITPSCERKIARSANRIAPTSASASSPPAVPARTQPEPTATTGAPPTRAPENKDVSRDASAVAHFGNDPDMTPMMIKLHLATAYKDIGDKEGACLLLDEVIHEGTPEQSAQARKLLAQLA